MSENIEPSPEDVKAIQKWLLAQPHLPDHLDEILIKRFIYSCKYSLLVTKETIDLYFTIRHHGSVIFANRDPLAPEVKQVHNVADILLLPNLTKNNYQIVLNRLRDTDPDHLIYNDSVKTYFMLMDCRLVTESTLPAGEVHLFDLKGSSIRHISRWVLSTLKIYLNYTQNAMPVKVREVHLFNCPSFMDKIFFIVKPMLREGVMDYIFTHPTGSNKLFDHIPQELLPNEYGGAAGSIDEIKYTLINKMEGMRDYFLDDAKWKVDESKRLKSPKKKQSNKLDSDGFKSLSID